MLEELELRRCDACGASDCEMGSVEAEVGSAHIRVSLGRAARGDSAGSLVIYSTNAAANLGSAALLK